MAKAIFGASVKENSPKSGRVEVSTIDTVTPAQLSSLLTAIDAITLGTLQKAGLTTNVALPALIKTGVPPKTAQRGEKILVKGRASLVNDPLRIVHTIEIPTGDKSLIAVAGSDNIDITVGAAATFVSALNVVWKNDAGQAVAVESMQYVNRGIQ
jgi:hypothetical protein